MYGYIRPNRGELRVRDYELFQSAYCGLCRALARRHGFFARFAVNYDLTFLAMLLARGCGEAKRCFCPAHPFRRRRCVCGEAAFDDAADLSVILAWWKLRDEIADGGFWTRLVSRLALLFLRRAYARALSAHPDFAAAVAQGLETLAALERAESDELDRTADTFAGILASAADAAEPVSRRRSLRELLYHVGRSVYLLDAADDFSEDVKSGNYNPLRFRYGDELDEQEKEQLAMTLNLSQQQAVRAMELLDKTVYTPIIQNVLYYGLPQITQLVLSGDWKRRKKLRREYARRVWSESI